MTLVGRLARSTEGAAAAEMALVLPLMLVIMIGGMEGGNYMMNEHIVLKAVRDGARFAARQSFSHFSSCAVDPNDQMVADTRKVVMTGLLSGGTNRIVNWSATTVSVTATCSTTKTGIYTNMTNGSGAPIVTVSATVPYTPVLGSFGFTGRGKSIYASEQAAVMGI